MNEQTSDQVSENAEEEEEYPPTPWHLKLLLLGLVLYLVYRAVQFLIWAANSFL